MHEHVEAENVLAVGETIELRSDCIRETPEGEDGRELKRKDVHDFAVVLLQALTQGKTSGAVLPAPFEQMVRKGMSGEWGLVQIGAALEGKAAVAAAPVLQSSAVPVAGPVEGVPVARRAEAIPVPAPSVSRRIRGKVEERRRRFGVRGVAYLLGIVFLVLLGWFFMHGKAASSSAAAPSAAPQQAATESPANVALSVSEAAPPAEGTAMSSTEDSRGRWRVVAFTYNQEEQARQKATTIAQVHPDLNPTVFTPNGHAPFLVTLGGQMSKQDAFVFSGKAKREGMPKDTYAQNYRGNGN